MATKINVRKQGKRWRWTLFRDGKIADSGATASEAEAKRDAAAAAKSKMGPRRKRTKATRRKAARRGSAGRIRAAARADAKTYSDEFPGARPDEAWAAAAYEMIGDKPDGGYDVYWPAFRAAVETRRSARKTKRAVRKVERRARSEGAALAAAIRRAK